MDDVSNRPILLADIDGVLNPRGAHGGAAVSGGRHSGRVPDEIVAHVALLADRFDWWWCSAWEDAANDELAELLGLGPRPVVRLTWGGFDSWKLSAVAATVQRCAPHRPVAWMDDHIGARARRWAQHRDAPTLVVGVDAHRGLEVAHVEQLCRFADTNTGQSTHPHVVPVVEGLGARRAAFLVGRRLHRRTAAGPAAG